MKYIACYGDSLVQGFPFGPRYSWTAQVEKLTQIKMLNYGVCGDCCDDIIYRMRQYALPEYVQHVIFLGGANDILQGRRLEPRLQACAGVVRGKAVQPVHRAAFHQYGAGVQPPTAEPAAGGRAYLWRQGLPAGFAACHRPGRWHQVQGLC